MLLSRISTDSDLSEAAMEWAKSKCYGELKTLVVSTAEITLGVKLSKMYKIELQVDTYLPRDAWYITSEWFGIFSPGA